MSRHNKMPPVPPTDRDLKGGGHAPDVEEDTSSKTTEDNDAERVIWRNMRRNTTNAGCFHGCRAR